MKKLVSILLILATVFCFTACQSEPSDKKIKEAFIGEFEYDKILWSTGMFSSTANSLPGTDLVGKKAFKFDGEKWDDKYSAEITNIQELTDDEKALLQPWELLPDEYKNSAKKIGKYKHIYKVYINSKKENTISQHIYYYADGEIWYNKADIDTASVERAFMISLKKI